MKCFDLKLGFKCNNNCLHCVVANKRNTEDLNEEDIKNIIDSIPKGEDYFVQITGGEPSLYKTLPYTLKLCKERGFYTVIQTNGTGFANLQYLQECKPYIDHIHIAIHSCYPEIHDKIVGSTGMWSKTIHGLDNIIKEKIYFTTQTVLSNINIDSLYDTFKFIQKKKRGTRMSMTYPHLNGNAYLNKDEICFKYSEKSQIIQKTLKKYHKYIFSESIPYCYLHPYAHKVESLERDIFCNLTRIGVDCSDGKEFVKDYNTLNLEEHCKGPLCKECIYDSVCIGVWKEYFELYGEELDLYPVMLK